MSCVTSPTLITLTNTTTTTLTHSLSHSLFLSFTLSHSHLLRCELRHFPEGILHAVVWREGDGDTTVVADVVAFALSKMGAVVEEGGVEGEWGVEWCGMKYH